MTSYLEVLDLSSLAMQLNMEPLIRAYSAIKTAARKLTLFKRGLSPFEKG